MTEQHCFIHNTLPGLNEILYIKHGKFGHFGYQRMKRDCEERIGLCLAISHIKPVKRAWIDFEWIEKNRRRDPDNITAGGRKFILDTLVWAGILKDDGWDEVAGWTDKFTVNKDNPGIKLTIKEK